MDASCIKWSILHSSKFKIAPSSSFRYKFWARPPGTHCYHAPSCTVEHRQLKDCLEHCMQLHDCQRRQINLIYLMLVTHSMLINQKYTITLLELTDRKRVSWPFVHTSTGIRYQTGIPSIDSDSHKAYIYLFSQWYRGIGPCTLLVRFNGQGI